MAHFGLNVSALIVSAGPNMNESVVARTLEHELAELIRRAGMISCRTQNRQRTHLSSLKEACHPAANHRERKTAAGQFGSIGWHAFRHTYRSWLDLDRGSNAGILPLPVTHLGPCLAECIGDRVSFLNWLATCPSAIPYPLDRFNNPAI